MPTGTGTGDARRFTFRIGRRSVPLLWLFGVRADRAWVVIDDERVAARFGYGTISVPLSNITRWRIEGPWRWITAIGIRMSIRDRDLSFAGSPRGGVRLDLREPLRWGPLRPPAIYLGVEDLEGFAAELERRGIPGEDARTER
jgi:hypothetical protein